MGRVVIDSSFFWFVCSFSSQCMRKNDAYTRLIQIIFSLFFSHWKSFLFLHHFSIPFSCCSLELQFVQFKSFGHTGRIIQCCWFSHYSSTKKEEENITSFVLIFVWIVLFNLFVRIHIVSTSSSLQACACINVQRRHDNHYL